MDDAVIEVNQLVDGRYERQYLTIEQILAEREKKSKVQRPKPRIPDAVPQLGILSRTVIPSPVINHILPAQIRHSSKNDIVFVGEDFIHLKELQEDGHLKDVASKTFVPRIRSARVLGPSKEVPEPEPGHIFVKREDKVANGDHPMIERQSWLQDGSDELPPQCLVITLESHEVMFLCAKDDEENNTTFFAHVRPLPSAQAHLEQPGKFLAVDPSSRAIAIAAPQSTMVLYATRDIKKMRIEPGTACASLDLVEEERVVGFKGSVLQMEFLSQSRQYDDQIALMVLLAYEGSVCLSCYEWNHSESLKSFREVFSTLPLLNCKKPSSAVCDLFNHRIDQGYPLLLIPLKYSQACIIVGEDGIYHFKDVLVAGVTPTKLGNAEIAVPQDRLTKSPPQWTSWTRPNRNFEVHERVHENYYLLREDGAFFYIEVDKEIGISAAGSFNCNVGTAFNFLPLTLQDPDHLIAAGTDSYGELVSIGHSPRHHRSKLSREDTLSPVRVESLPNWAPCMDLVVEKADIKDGHTARDSLFVTSGRTPHGSLLQLRQGVNAKLLTRIQTGFNFGNATGLWLIAAVEGQDLLLLISFPTHSELVYISSPANDEPHHASENDDDGIVVAMGPPDDENGQECAVDRDHETLAAGCLGVDRAIQITRDGLLLFDSNTLQLIAGSSRPCGDPLSVAVIHNQYVVIASSSPETTTSNIFFARFNRDQDQLVWIGNSVVVQSDPTCMALLTIYEKQFVVVCTREAQLNFFEISTNSGLTLAAQHQIKPDQENANAMLPICESLSLLPSHSTSSILLCGMRDGTIQAIEILSDSSLFDPAKMEVDGPIPLQVGSTKSHTLGISSVRLFRASNDVLASCDSSFCRLTRLNGHNARLEVEQVWFDDAQQPYYVQSPVGLLVSLPYNSRFIAHGLSESIVCLSGDEILATWIEEDSAKAVVPRKIPIEGSPNRAIPEPDGTFAISHLQSETTIGPDGTGLCRTRCLVEFIDLHDNFDVGSPKLAWKTHILPGRERANCLESWSMVNGTSSINLVAVGITLTPASGRVTGRILFLRKTIRSDGSFRLKVVKYKECPDGPVYAMCCFPGQDNKLVFGSGTNLVVLEFDLEERKQKTVAIYPSLPSQAVHITISNGIIYVTTSKHSIQAFRFTYRQGEENNTSFELLFTDSRHRSSTNHLVAPVSQGALLPKSSDIRALSKDRIITLVADKSNTITGLLQPHTKANQNAAPVLFEAALPRSITRLRHGNTRPPWTPSVLRDVVPYNVLGTAADGTLVAFDVVGRCAWQVLKVLECLAKITASYEEQRTYNRPDIIDTGEVNLRTRRCIQAEHMILAIARMRKNRTTSVEDDDVYERLDILGALTPKDYHINGDLLLPLRTKNIAREVQTMLDRLEGRDGLQTEITAAWTGVVDDFAPEDCTDKETFVAEWVVDVLGPCL